MGKLGDTILEEIVAQVNDEWGCSQKLLRNQDCVSDSLRIGLVQISDLHPEFRTISKSLDDPFLNGSEDHTDLFDPSPSHLVETIHQHRLVGDGQHVLVPGIRQRAKSRPMPTSKQ